MTRNSTYRLFPTVARRVLCGLVASAYCVSLVVSEAQGATVDKFFPEARTVFKTEAESATYTLALAPLKKINNQWRSERERRVSGPLLRRTLEIPDGRSVDEIHQQLRQELQRFEARPLYTCEGLDCGSSNTWANNHFNIKQLYGLDQNQYYGVWELEADDSELYYLTTYVVQRGNQRIYVQIDQLRAPAAEQGTVVTSPATLVDTLRRQGYFALPGVTWSGDTVSVEKEHLKAVTEALQRDPWIKIRIVGHDYGPGTLDEQLERSRSVAKQVTTHLLRSGVKGERVTAHGVGSLAPAGKRGSARIEVIMQ